MTGHLQKIINLQRSCGVYYLHSFRRAKLRAMKKLSIVLCLHLSQSLPAWASPQSPEEQAIDRRSSRCDEERTSRLDNPGKCLRGECPPIYQRRDLRCFSKHLGRLKQMGVQTLWFMPSTDQRHRPERKPGSYYAVSDYMTINPNSDSCRVQETGGYRHGMGMKVIIDWCPTIPERTTAGSGIIPVSM